MLVAELLRVKTGRFNFTPQLDEGDKIKAASLQIAKTDPCRRTLIGLAPVLFGLITIFALRAFVFQPAAGQSFSQLLNSPWSLLLALMSFYLLFAVSNTMFSSSKDLEAAFLPFFIFFLVVVFFWLTEIKINLSTDVFNFLANVFDQLNSALKITIIFNFLLLLVIKIFIYFLKRF